MSQHFSLSRFARLFSKHTAEYGGGYLLATGVLIGGIALVLGFIAFMGGGPLVPDVQGVIFVMGLLAAGAFFTSTVFAPLGDKRQATAALMLPASHWEKYVVGWLYAVPIYLAVYIGCFFLVDALVLQVEGKFGPKAPLVVLFSNETHLYFSLLVYLVVSAVFLWGSIFFVKQQFVRTAFAVLIIVVALAVLNMQLVQTLLGREVSNAVPLSGMSFQDGQNWYSVNLSPAQNSLFMEIMLGGLLLLGWVGAYVRLTEKEV
ncbi:hypothetical protein [Hymenobacter negativus]|uniref:ABC transporter permease n=1 Tax=Hymenobacter negativus TaxID=2795026 RepID=A0ABS3QJM8_9BACT|nr:hypothetical protein [Hymenobacter negativus]MBO2011442.1 hypothetical protein [Hymenobacter negativus]